MVLHFNKYKNLFFPQFTTRPRSEITPGLPRSNCNSKFHDIFKVELTVAIEVRKNILEGVHGKVCG